MKRWISLLAASLLVPASAWAVNGPWSVTFPQPSVDTLDSIATNGTVDVAVGRQGEVLTSSDGTHWARVVTGYEALADNLVSVIWTGSRFYAIGDAGLVLSSTDGAHWSGQYPLPGNYIGTVQGFSTVSSGNGEVVLGDAPGLNLSSTNGTTWKVEDRTLTAFYSYYKLFWFAGNFYGLSGLFESSPDGLNLGQQVSIPSGSVCDVTTNGSIMVATDNGGHFYTTTDGTHWNGPGPTTPVACFPFSNSRTQLQWTGKDFAWLVSNSTYYSSTDGLNWTPRQISNNYIFTQLIWDGSKYIGIGAFGLIATSPDGVNFTQVAGAGVAPNQAESMAWTGSTYVIGLNNLGNDVSLLVGSGSSWQAVAQPILHVSFVNDTLYGFSNLTFRMMTSKDGISWNNSTLTPGLMTDLGFTAVAGDGNSQVTAVGQNAGAISTDDGATWTPATVSFSEAPRKLIHAQNQYVGISFSHIITSSDGIHWNEQQPLTPAGGTAGFTDVLFGNGMYIAFSQDGSEFTSPDAVTWTSRTALPGNTSNALWRAVWDGQEFIAVGLYTGFTSGLPSGSTLWTSADGLTWYPELVPPGMTAAALVVGNGEVLVGGARSDVARAVPGQRGVPIAHAVSVSIDPSMMSTEGFNATDPQSLPLTYLTTFGQSSSFGTGNGNYFITIPHQASGNFVITPTSQPATTPFSFDYMVSNDVVFSAPATVSVTVAQPAPPPPTGGGGGSSGGKSGGGGVGMAELCGLLVIAALRRRMHARDDAAFVPGRGAAARGRG